MTGKQGWLVDNEEEEEEEEEDPDEEEEDPDEDDNNSEEQSTSKRTTKSLFSVKKRRCCWFWNDPFLLQQIDFKALVMKFVADDITSGTAALLYIVHYNKWSTTCATAFSIIQLSRSL